jgi:U3 small nucleolar RNA-associated protein 14
VKIRKSRLGELEPSNRRKRARNEDENEDEEDEEDEPKRRRKEAGSSDEGSDSEGNNWTLGHVDSDDDSDIDSDEAFGESDEEKFEGWVFRGSASTHNGGKTMQKKGKSRKLRDEDEDMGGEIDLDEGDSADGEEDEDEDDLGEDAIDLATALDQYEESDEEEEEEKQTKSKKAKKAQKVATTFDDSEPSEEEDFAADGASDFSGFEDDEDDDDAGDSEDEDEKVERLRNLISSLPGEEETALKSTRRVDVHESGAPSEFGVMRKVDLLSYKPQITDPEKRKSLKLLQDDLKSSKRNDIARKLEAPLPKRQQDKLDRAVANEKANETLSRWVDTVKQNRRAEHISFPLKNPNESEAMGESRLMPTTAAAPANDLESTIQSILQQSGLSNGKDDEERLAQWEELQTNKLPLEEVAKRRAQLRLERELLFREEIRAKRIKKIKSKAYRRVHRKEREKMMERERDALKADGVDVSEDEREYNDRRRAEERMGAKHRESKWAKGVKQSGRAAWDEDARAGVTEMARRNEELRRRIEGKEVVNEDEEGSDVFSEEEEDEDYEDEDENQVLQKQLGRLKENPFSTDNSKLGSMLFMQKAEAARKARNDEDVERIRRELAGEESHSEEEDENSARAGRRKYAPISKAAMPAIQIARSEFEERLGSDEEDEDGQDSKDRPRQQASGTLSGKSSKPSSKSVSGSQNPYLTKATKDKGAEKEPDALWKAQDTVSTLQSQPAPKGKPKSKPKSKAETSNEDALPEPQVSAPDADGWQTVTYGQESEHEDEEDVENEGIDLDIVLRNQALTAKGFAGDNVEADFAAEKAAQVEEEAEKEITTHLPGWGAWVGEGLSKNAQKNKGKKSVQKQSGVKQEKRKDLKLEKVIINEKKIKKNSKFLATQLPFPFETKEQYERSLRLPKGPEWTTKMTYQDATKPRVLVKQGIILPMRKPMV